MPDQIVVRDSPVASATAELPPQPKAKASAAAQCRRSRSFNNGPSQSYLERRISTVEASIIHSLHAAAAIVSRSSCIYSSYFCPVPYHQETQKALKIQGF